jgi:cell division septation protein DedD
MKRSDIKDNSVLFIGKWIIIIAVLVTSSLGFILGYLVGKNFHRKDVNLTSVIPSDKSTEQQTIESDASVVGTQENDRSGLLIQQPTALQQSQEPQNAKTYAQTENPPQTKGGKEISAIQGKKEIKEPTNTQKNVKPTKYAVQAGAFKNVSDANLLKEKLDKKGYKTYIIRATTKNNEKIYKVIVGEFATRKEAELLSIKMKKVEGLRTFVTFKSKDEEVLR